MEANASALVRAGVADALAARCRTLLERLEAAQYGLAPVAGDGGLAAETSTEGLSDLIKALDRQLRGRQP